MSISEKLVQYNYIVHVAMVLTVFTSLTEARPKNRDGMKHLACERKRLLMHLSIIFLVHVFPETITIDTFYYCF